MNIILKPAGTAVMLVSLSILTYLALHHNAKNATHKEMSASISPITTLSMATANTTPKDMPEPSLSLIRENAAGNSLLVDSFEKGLFAGPFKSYEVGAMAKIVVEIHPYASGSHNYLWVDVQSKNKEYAGIWGMVGEHTVQQPQNWQGATGVSFLIYCSRPTTLQFHFKAVQGTGYDTTANIKKDHQWVRVVLPLHDWKGVGAEGIGGIIGYDVRFPDGISQWFALDDLRVLRN